MLPNARVQLRPGKRTLEGASRIDPYWASTATHSSAFREPLSILLKPFLPLKFPPRFSIAAGIHLHLGIRTPRTEGHLCRYAIDSCHIHPTPMETTVAKCDR